MTSNITPVATSVFHIWNDDNQNFRSVIKILINPQSILNQSSFNLISNLIEN